MVRRINRDVVRESLRTDGEAIIAELSRRTGLSPATCSNIVPELIRDGEAVELPYRLTKGGRPARVYGYNPAGTLILALFLLHGENGAVIRHVVRDGAGALVDEGAVAAQPFSLDCVHDRIESLRRSFPAIRALALSVPGVVDSDNGGMLICDIPELRGVKVEEEIRSRHGLATVVENDMNFAAIGYASTHPETRKTGLAFISLPHGDCAGCGLVVNGTLLKGKSDFAGEISFIPFGEFKSAEETAARLASAVIAVVNPGSVVLSGAAVKPEMLPEIREHLLKWIPERHHPEIIVRPEYQADALDGMTAMAMAGLACGVRLVENTLF